MKDKYVEYEKQKKKVNNLNYAEYEKQVRKIVKELKI